ncbi:MAG: NAD(P)H-dependent oxidoreductase subunit E [Minicystis sp.]
MADPLPGPLAAELDAILRDGEEPARALVPMLRAAQRALGWIADDVLQALAARAGVEVEDAANIAAYFDFRREKPVAARVVEVCVNINCQRRGGAAILDHCRARLGLEVGETSADGAWALHEIVCLKRCESGPALRYRGEIFDALTPARVDEILG